MQGKGVPGIWWVEVWDAIQYPSVQMAQMSAVPRLDTCPRRGASALLCWRSWEEVLCSDSLSKTTLAARKRRQSSLESLAQVCLRDTQTSPQVPFSQRMPALRGSEAEGLESAQHLAQRGPENRHRGSMLRHAPDGPFRSSGCYMEPLSWWNQGHSVSTKREQTAS